MGGQGGQDLLPSWRVTDVEKGLLKIKKDKATGPDRIPGWILIGLAGILAPPLCAIFNSSLRQGYVPPMWKSDDTCPLPKVKLPKGIEKDLCPISLTSVLAKCLEKHVCGWIMELAGDQTDPQQYGAVSGSSTVHALVEMVHKWHHALDSPGRIVRILLLDFSKAFDRVDDRILLDKLSRLGTPQLHY